MKVRVRWEGDTRFASEMLGRARPSQLRTYVFPEWYRDVQDYYRRMFRTGGRISGEPRRGGKWAKNSPWTVAEKGHSKPLLSRRQFQFGAMVRSLAVRVISHRQGGHTWEMTNKARSKDGFDYPAHLHAPKRRGRFTVLPHTAKALKLVSPSGQTIYRASTSPRRPKPRPHIFFQERMVRAWIARMSNWVLEGKVSKYRRAA